MADDPLVAEHLEIDRKRFALDEEKFSLDKRRFELEQDNARLERRFWHRNFAAMTTFSIAALGLLISGAQVWIAQFQKANDLGIAEVHRQNDLAIAELHRQADADAAERRDFREFLTHHQDMIDKILTGSAEDLSKLTSLASASFSSKVVQPLIDRLQPVASSPEQKQKLAQAQALVDQIDAQSTKPTVYLHYQDANDKDLAQQVAQMLSASGYRVPPIEHVTQPTKGDVRFFHMEDREQAARIAQLVHAKLQQTGRDQTITPLDVSKTFPNVSTGRFEVWIPATQ